MVANPANTNAIILKENAPKIPAENVTALTRLDHNRALGQVSQRLGVPSKDVRNVIIWGNHSATQYPDIHHCTVAGTAAMELVDQDWTVNDFIPTVQQRGAAIIKARGASSAASAANAAIEHMRDWALGTSGKTVSMGIHSDGSYGVEKGLIYSFPVTCSGGSYEIVQGLDVNAFSQELMDKTETELREERDAIAELLP